MNILKVSTKFALSLILFLFAFSSIAVAKVDSGPHPPAKVNWLNFMGCDQTEEPCVRLTDVNNTILFVLRIRVGTSNVNYFPEMRFSYDIGNGAMVGLTDPVTVSNVYPVQLYDGTEVYEASFPISVSVNYICDAPYIPSDHSFLYNIKYQLVTTDHPSLPGVHPYPWSFYPDLFPRDIFQMKSAYAPEEKIIKKVCCFDDISIDCSNHGMSTPPNEHTTTFREGTAPQSEMLQNKDVFNAYPNPVQAELEVNYSLNSAGDIRIMCLDANGRVVAQKDFQHKYVGNFNCSFSTEDWSSGIYFIRLLGEGEVQTLKVIKI